jgi:hypothetical protein
MHWHLPLHPPKSEKSVSQQTDDVENGGQAGGLVLNLVLITQQRNEFKQHLAVEEETEDDNSKQAVMKENEDPNENPNFAPPFVVDLLTQENGCDQQSVQSPSCSTATFLGGWESSGWTNTSENWVRLFQACSTEGGADCFVDKRALGEVASSLFRDLTSEFSAAKNCG